MKESKISKPNQGAAPDVLFSGKPEFFGGLSNEVDLVQTCPEEFKKDNQWSEYASKIFYGGADITNWKWKSSDKEVRKNQLGCFHGLLGSFSIAHEDKEAVAGWMLSQMLEKVPTYTPSKKK